MPHKVLIEKDLCRVRSIATGIPTVLREVLQGTWWDHERACGMRLIVRMRPSTMLAEQNRPSRTGMSPGSRLPKENRGRI